MRKLPNHTRLVPFERHLSAIRWQFVRGTLVGILISSVTTMSGLEYLKLRHSGPLLWLEPAQKQTAPESSSTQAQARTWETTSEATSEPATSQAGPFSPNFADNPGEGVLTTDRQFLLPPRTTGSYFSQPQPTKKTLSRLAQLWASTEAGDANAAAALADVYLRGDGIPVNCDQGRILLFVASKENNAQATKKLQQLSRTGCPVP